MTNTISVVGLGKLGLPLAACFAEKGFDTIGVDSEEMVNSINKARSPIFEPGLQELVAKHGGKKLKASSHHSEAIEKSSVTFVVVATPSNPDGTFSNRYVEAALKSLSEALRKNTKRYHLFVISSTVVPGSTESSLVPIIEQYSGRKLNVGFGVCYDPDFAALGEVIEGYVCPDLVIIGESSIEAGDLVEGIHQQLCDNQPHIRRMSLMSAEIAKVSLNSYLTLKISYANTLANICENIQGADLDAITEAIGVDRRISPLYLQGGLSFGGACFPRDTRAFVAIAERYGNNADLIRAVEKVNQYQDEHLLELVLRELSVLEVNTVGVLGLSFKPNTPVVTDSPAIKLIRALLDQDVAITAYDPLALENAKAMFEDSIEYASSVEECLDRSSLCVITHRSNEIKRIVEEYVNAKPLVIIDCWRLLDPSKLNEKLSCRAWGYAPKASVSSRKIMRIPLRQSR